MLRQHTSAYVSIRQHTSAYDMPEGFLMPLAARCSAASESPYAHRVDSSSQKQLVRISEGSSRAEVVLLASDYCYLL